MFKTNKKKILLNKIQMFNNHNRSILLLPVFHSFVHLFIYVLSVDVLSSPQNFHACDDDMFYCSFCIVLEIRCCCASYCMLLVATEVVVVVVVI